MKLDHETMRIARALPVSPETVECVMVRTKRDAKLAELVVRTALETQQSVVEVLEAVDRLRAESGQS